MAVGNPAPYPPAQAGLAFYKSRALYLPSGRMARKLLIGHRWSHLNIGALIRQRKGSDPWLWPNTLTGKKFAIGLCSGVSAPVGSVTPAHFIGVITDTSWTRLQSSGFWQTGFKVVSIQNGVQTVHQTGVAGMLRVDIEGSQYGSGWYIKAIRTNATTLDFYVFGPNSRHSISRKDFAVQMARTKFTTSVNSHSGFSLYSNIAITIDEGTYGDLDTFCLASWLPAQSAAILDGLEVLETRAHLIS